ncbi:class I adenylate-forming enzyme family protein [Marmoricola endophyticus]|uniref:class I adenylate-forming enzyme family protein n=1 Tax=Marmoricola endophyticus TaxID=2040280 RepID=UPI001E336688|nr:AMP-binding protein [Marmoricola endophyticus]
MLTQPRGSSLGRLAEVSEERFGADSTLLFEGRELTTAQLGERGRRFAAGLASLGVGPGDRVALCMANCPEVLETYRAIWRLGAVMTPLMFLLSADEIRHAVSDSGAKVLVTTPDQLDKVAIATDGLDVRLVVVGDVDRPGVTSYADLASGEEAPLADVDAADMAALLYTGGTTGRSKGVVLSHDALSSAAWNTVNTGLTSGLTVSLLPLPMAHVFGMMVSASALHAVQPQRTVLMRWFDAAEWVRLAEAEKVQSGAVVPTMLRLLLSQPLEEHDLSPLRRLGSGSAPLPPEVREEWARRVPHVEVVEGYGASETAAMATTTYPGRVRPGSVGEASSEVEIRIERLDGSGEAGPDEDGEVLVRHPGLMTGYWQDPEATAAAMTDGFFRTGDVGHLDADGFLFLVDRLKDVVIRSGFNVYPSDVEEALEKHPAVAVAAVVGRPDEAHGEEVVAFVQPRPDATVTPEELIAFGREHLSRAKYPREVHLVDAVPLTSIGKLDRKALRARL